MTDLAAAVPSRVRTVSAPSFWAVASSFAARALQRITRMPSLILPSLIMPVFFVVAFSGSFSAAVGIEGYGTDEAVNWMTAWALLQGSAFGGNGAAGAAATDIENGFFDRVRLAPIEPLAFVVGLWMYAMVRAVIPTTAVLLVATWMGADYPGGVLGVVLVYVGAIGLTTAVSMFALSIAFTLKSVRSMAVSQMGTFGFMFLSIGQAPLQAIEGWLHGVARLNPVTNIIRMTRQGFLGEVTWSTTWPGLLAMAGMGVFFGALALRQLRRITD